MWVLFSYYSSGDGDCSLVSLAHMATWWSSVGRWPETDWESNNWGVERPERQKKKSELWWGYAEDLFRRNR